MILYQTEDGRTRIQCRFENETLWLSQALIAELFQKDVRTINEHLVNIFAEGELDKEATIRKFRIVQKEGARQVTREVEHYSLAAILAVGYRVRSHRGTQFRQWATARLSEYLVKGFTMDDERLKNPPGKGQKDYFAWGENTGWLRFKGASPDYGMRTRAFDAQAQGTPNWWLDHHDIDEGFDAGDGVPAWRKYVMDTDHHVAGDYLRIMAITNAPAAMTVAFTPASTRRYYTLKRRDGLTEGGWSNVTGQAAVQYGSSGEKTMQDTNRTERAFYNVVVTVTP
jgi:hypothetical protein